MLIHPKSDKVNANEYYYGEEIKQQTDKVVLKRFTLRQWKICLIPATTAIFSTLYSFAT